MVSTHFAQRLQPVGDVAAQGVADRELRVVEESMWRHAQPKHDGL
jgi:hypothetical protein